MWCSAVGCIVTLILSLLVAPRATTAQPRGTIPRVAVLVPTAQERPTPCLFAFQQGLRDLGYVEGQTIRLDYRYGEGHADRLPALATELAQPGDNLTGLELPAIEVSGKRLELFKDAVPTISRVAVLVDPAQAAHADVPSNIAREAQALGVQLQRVEAGAPAAFEAAVTAM